MVRDDDGPFASEFTLSSHPQGPAIENELRGFERLIDLINARPLRDVAVNPGFTNRGGVRNDSNTVSYKSLLASKA